MRGCIFYLRAWSTTLPCLIVAGGIICSGAGFSSNLENVEVKNDNVKQNNIAEHWKFNLKMVSCQLNGVEGRGWWANSFFTLSLILRTLVYLIIWSTLHKVR